MKIFTLISMLFLSCAAFADGHNEHNPPEGAGSSCPNGGCGD